MLCINELGMTDKTECSFQTFFIFGEYTDEKTRQGGQMSSP